MVGFLRCGRDGAESGQAALDEAQDGAHGDAVFEDHLRVLFFAGIVRVIGCGSGN